MRTGLLGRRGICAAVAFGPLLWSACAFDWDGYDPRLRQLNPTEVCEPNQEEACYSGPATTLDVGICRAGTRMCAADGSAWGSCEGQIIPAEEDCGAPEDEDCDGSNTDPDAGCGCIVGSSESCYSGIAEQLNVGICREGTRFCDIIDGVPQFGPCVGETLPISEQCDTAVDDNCDDEANDFCATAAVRYGNSATQKVEALVLADPDALFAGDFSGQLNLGNNVSAIATISSDGFAARIDSTGAGQWLRPFTGGGRQTVAALSRQVGNAIAVGGSFNTEINYGGAPTPKAAGAYDGFVALLNANNGTVSWSYEVGATGEDGITGVSINTQNEVIAVGYFEGSANFGGNDIAASGRDGFILQFTPAGSLKDHFIFGGMFDDEPTAIAVDAQDDIYVVGEFRDSVTFGGQPLVGGNEATGFAARLTSQLSQVWARPLNTSGNSRATALAVRNNRIAVVGEYDQDVDLGLGVINGTAERDLFVAVYDEMGTPQWGHGFGDAQVQQAEAVAIDDMGRVFFGASMRGTVEVQEQRFHAAGNDDMLLLSFSNDGALRFGRRFGDSADQDFRALALGENLLVGAANCAGTVNFGSGPLTGTSSNSDICIIAVQP